MNPIAWGHRGLPALGVGAIILVALSGVPPLAELGCVEVESQAVSSGGTNGAAAVFAADLDGDGDTDILSASTNDDTIAWYESDGGTPPAFTQRIISTLADGASSVFAADVDGDSHIDVLSASGNDDKISWYRNDGEDDPEFTESVISTTASNAASVYAVDLDDDGLMDVLSASINDNEVAWYRQVEETDEEDQPTGVFSFVKFFVTTSASGASSVFAADINGDERLDVLSASRFDNTIAWFDRTVVEVDGEDDLTVFIRHNISTLADGARSVYAADLDDDGDVDVLSASYDDDEIAWYENIPVEEEVEDPVNEGEFITITVNTFTKRGISIDADGAASVFAIDVDGDELIDVVSGSAKDGKVAWYRNDGQDTPVFIEEVISLDAPGARSVYATRIVPADPAAAGDPGGMGEIADILSASSISGGIARDDKIAWYENDGADPEFTEHIVSGGSVAPEVILGVDVNNDGFTDVIAGSSSDNSVAWYQSDGEDPPGFTRVDIDFDVLQPSSLFWEDIDGDDFEDLLVASFGDDTIAWYRNDGLSPPGFERHIVSTDADGAFSVFAADVDGDDDVDILSASNNDDRIAWYENVMGEEMAPDGEEFIEHIITVDALGARSVFAADMDGDGDMDVLSASFDDNTIAWYENDGDEQEPVVFTGHVISTSAFGAQSVYAANIDDHGDIDVVTASANDDTISWFRNLLVQPEDPEDPPVRIFTEYVIDLSARFARYAFAADMDNDLDLDVVSVSSSNNRVAWYESDLAQQEEPSPTAGEEPPDEEDPPPPPPTWNPHLVSSTASSSRWADVADMDGDDVVDILSAFLFEIVWHRNDATEVCVGFDANEDMRIDGVEVIWLGKAFGESCADPDNPEEWWLAVDTNDDCTVDGDDLAILASRNVWARYTEDPDPDDDEDVALCQFTCQ